MAITGTKLFTAGAVLTAAQTNQYLMRGVKVYADAATRDAAYGGAGEPTLEEGEACYLLDINAVQVYTGTVWTTWPGPGLPYAASSPANPVDGQIWYYQPTGTATAWTLRYNAGSASIYKWECVGGTPAVIQQTAIHSTAATAANTFADTTTGNLTYTTPLGGAWLVSFTGGFAVGTTNVAMYAGVRRGATNPTIGTDATMIAGLTTEYKTMAMTNFFTGDYASGTALSIRTAQSAAAQVMIRIGGIMNIMPVRVA